MPSSPSDTLDAADAIDPFNLPPRVKRRGEIDYPCSMPAAMGAVLGGVVGAVMYKRRGTNAFAGAFIWGGAMMTSGTVRCNLMKSRNATVYDPPQYDSTTSYAAGLGSLPLLTRAAVTIFPGAGPIEPPAQMLLRSALLAAVGASVGFIVDYVATMFPDKPPPIREEETTNITKQNRDSEDVR